MDKNIVEEQCRLILATCRTFASEIRHKDEYGFLASIGSNLGKIKRETGLLD